jgi:hypothetical protein
MFRPSLPPTIPSLVLEHSLRFFKLQWVTEWTQFQLLKPCISPPDVPVAQPPRRGPLPLPPSGSHRMFHRRQSGGCPRSMPSAAASPSDVQSSSSYYRLHSVSNLPADLPAPPDRHGGIWSAASTYDVCDLGGSCGEMTFDDGSQLCRPMFYSYLITQPVGSCLRKT